MTDTYCRDTDIVQLDHAGYSAYMTLAGLSPGTKLKGRLAVNRCRCHTCSTTMARRIAALMLTETVLFAYGALNNKDALHIQH